MNKTMLLLGANYTSGVFRGRSGGEGDCNGNEDWPASLSEMEDGDHFTHPTPEMGVARYAASFLSFVITSPFSFTSSKRTETWRETPLSCMVTP